MPVCANCSRELQPDWKFCITCGAATGVPLTEAIQLLRIENGIAVAPDAPAAPQPAPEPVLRAEDIPGDELDVDATVIPNAAPAPAQPVNILAVLALILGCLVSPLAALFGHLALSQINKTGEHGTAIAWVAVVLGYLSLAALLVLIIGYFALNG